MRRSGSKSTRGLVKLPMITPSGTARSAAQKKPITIRSVLHVIACRSFQSFQLGPIDRLVKPGDVVVPGRFDYQACDDKVCYRPVKTEVAWTLTVTP